MIYTGIICGAVCLLGLCLHRPLTISHVQAACEDTGRGQQTQTRINHRRTIKSYHYQPVRMQKIMRLIDCLVVLRIVTGLIIYENVCHPNY
jgi:hypothetical protein